MGVGPWSARAPCARAEFMTGVVNAGHSGHLQGSGALLGKTEGSQSFLAGGTQGVGKVTGRVCGQGVYDCGVCRGRKSTILASWGPFRKPLGGLLGCIGGLLGRRQVIVGVLGRLVGDFGPFGPSWEAQLAGQRTPKGHLGPGGLARESLTGSWGFTGGPGAVLQRPCVHLGLLIAMKIRKGQEAQIVEKNNGNQRFGPRGALFGGLSEASCAVLGAFWAVVKSS